MPDTPRSPRNSWLALAAFLGVLSLATAGAEACATTRDATACATSCGCCVLDPASSGGDVAAENVVFVAHPGDFPTAAMCGNAPAGGCSCRASQPEAPEPRSGQRTQGEQTGPTRGTITARALVPAPGIPADFLSAVAGPSRKVPLYLRTSRLLI